MNQLSAVEKCEASLALSSRIFILEKGTFGCCNPEMAFPKSSLLCTVTKNVAPKKVVFFSCSVLGQRNRRWTPKTLFLRWDEIWVATPTGDFSKAKENSHKSWTFDATVFCKISKKRHYFKILRRAGFGRTTQKSFFREKNPGRSQLTFFVSSQSPEVGSTITVTIENMKKDVPFVMCKRYPAPISDTAHLCKRRASGPGRNQKIKKSNQEPRGTLSMWFWFWFESKIVLFSSLVAVTRVSQWNSAIIFHMRSHVVPPPPMDPVILNLLISRRRGMTFTVYFFLPTAVADLWCWHPLHCNCRRFTLSKHHCFVPIVLCVDSFLVQCTGKWRKRGVHVLCCCHNVAMGSDCVSRVKAAVDTKKRPQSW